MSILKVARMGHPVLRQRARTLTAADLRDPLIQKFIDDMIDTMHEYHGVGLAAPQVHEELRVFVALLDEDPGSDTEASVVINPEIVPITEDKEEGWEGCLSTDITLRGLDRAGKKVELSLKKFAARVAQHETDHLDGILFFERMSGLKTLTYLDEYSRYHAKDEEE